MKDVFITKEKGTYVVNYSANLQPNAAMGLVVNNSLVEESIKKSYSGGLVEGVHTLDLDKAVEIFLSVDGQSIGAFMNVELLEKPKEIVKIPPLRVALEFWLRNHPEWVDNDWSHLTDESRSDYGEIVRGIKPFHQMNHWDDGGDYDYEDGYFYDIIVEVNCRNKTPEIKFNQAAVLAFWLLNN